MQYTRQRIKTEGNTIYNPTHLYEPLRNAIKKSAIFETQQPSNNNFLAASSISNYNKSISYSNASRLRGEVIIPNKTLVATQNMERVRGKTFTAVDIQQRVGNPLSEEEFLKNRLGQKEQIVYEIQEEGNQIDKVFTYTAPNTIKGIHTYAKKNQRPTKEALMRESRVGNKFNPEHKQLKIDLRSTSTKLDSHQNNLSTHKKYTYLYNEAENQILIEPSKVKSYNFTNVRTKENLQRQVEQKKYNLFSILDQCGNNGCHKQCCKSNQFCAPKIERKGWK